MERIDWSGVELCRDPYGKLLDAVYDRNYSALYACLRKETGKYHHEQAYRLCSAAIQSGCTLKAFQTILEKCIPLEEFIGYGAAGNHIAFGKSGGLVQEAAACGQSHILKYLLSRGFSPNGRGGSECSALEAALRHSAVGCVMVLEQCDDVDFTITEDILELWGSMGKVPLLDTCFRIIAGRLLGEGKGVFYQEIPILPGLNVLHAAKHENWPLVYRLCQETEVTQKQGKQVLEEYMFRGDSLDAQTCAELLEALFSACPGLLRCEYPRYVLSLCMLCGDVEAVARLRPWVERLPGRTVVLDGRRLAEREYDIVECMKRWDERIGNRLQPVLRRDNLLPVRSMALATDETIRVLLERCAIRGTPTQGEISRLAMDVVQMASPALLAELCQSERLFPEEDMGLLLEYCKKQGYWQSLQKRNILLAYGKKHVDYAL